MDSAVEKKLLDDLNQEYGGEEAQVEYTEKDTQGFGMVSKSGKYHAFITKVKLQTLTRQTATKTKAVGSRFHFLNANIKLVSDITGAPVNTNTRASILYEGGSMLKYDQYCQATKCHKFDIGEGLRKYFPQADHTKGGSVGMPVIVEVELKRDQALQKDQVTGKYFKKTDAEGNPVMTTIAEVIAFYPWETEERYAGEPDNSTVPDKTGMADDDLPF